MVVLVYRKCSTCIKALKWLEENMDTRKTVMKDILGKDMCFEYLTAGFKSVDELIGNFKYDILVDE